MHNVLRVKVDHSQGYIIQLITASQICYKHAGQIGTYDFQTITILIVSYIHPSIAVLHERGNDKGHVIKVICSEEFCQIFQTFIKCRKQEAYGVCGDAKVQTKSTNVH